MHDFLLAQGAITKEGICSFGETPADYPALQEKTVISLLDSQGLLEIREGQSAKCLQGQLTCDVLSLSQNTVSAGAYCTPKGRMISNFLIASPASEHFQLRMTRACVKATAETLSKYSPFFKCEITDISDNYSLFGISGSEAKNHLASIFSSVPESRHDCLHGEGYTLISIDGKQRYECWIENRVIEALGPKLFENCAASGEAFWQLQNIREGLGQVHEETIEEWIPQMLNLQAIGGINFRKGCYTGQEIVARTQYRGKHKRAMFRLAAEGKNLPQAGDMITQGEKNVGEVVEAAFSDTNRFELLAVLNRSALEEAGTLQTNDSKTSLLSLPYAIDPEQEAEDQ